VVPLLRRPAVTQLGGHMVAQSRTQRQLGLSETADSGVAVRRPPSRKNNPDTLGPSDAAIAATESLASRVHLLNPPPFRQVDVCIMPADNVS
jgi:hypothetical protein